MCILTPMCCLFVTPPLNHLNNPVNPLVSITNHSFSTHSTQAAQSDTGSLIGTLLTRATSGDATRGHMGSSCLHRNKRVQRSWLGENNWAADRLATVKPGHIYPSSRQNDINQAVSKSTEARAPLTKPRSMLTGFHTQNTQGDVGGQL